jgi:hypothetical protein
MRARYRQDWSGHVALLSPGAVPSVDFYLTPRFAELAPDALHRFDSRAWDAAAQSLPVGTFVVIARHAASRWLRFLAEHPERWSGVAYFMDDDIPAAWRCRELPLDYRLRTSGRFLRIAHGLSGVCDRAWVSTDVLRARYPDWNATVLPPLDPFGLRPACAAGVRRWCYHGTRAHVREMRWLKPVVRAVQNRVPDAEFEIMGGAGVKRLFSGIPRVNVLAPRTWRDYAAYCENSSIALGVAPLLPGHFNAARAHVKIFDIAHCGAVGVYARRAPYFPALESSGAACADDDPRAWSDAIVALLTDDTRRLEQYARAAAWIAAQAPAPRLLDLIYPL